MLFFWYWLPAPPHCAANCASSCEQSVRKYLPHTWPRRSPTRNSNRELEVVCENGGTSSAVMYARFRSYERRVVHTTSRFVMSGTFKETSYVLFSTVPAFLHWLLKPDEADAGTWSIWSCVMSRAYVTFKPYLLNNSASNPNSVSVVFSGFRKRLPSWLLETVPPVPIVNVSY